MTTPFVLVHGAYHGGWCWRRVAGSLRSRGHLVLTVTLTGFGERAHLLSPEVGLDTMIDDVVRAVEVEELDNAVLVGHSFGALPVLAALRRLAPRTRQVVILDGLIVEPGEPGFSGLSADVARDRRAAAKRYPGGLAIPAPPAEIFGVTDPTDLAWVSRQLSPHPLRGFTDPFPGDGSVDVGTPVTYLRCTNPPFAGLSGTWKVACRQGWQLREVAAAHDAMITHPDLITSELIHAATSSDRGHEMATHR